MPDQENKRWKMYKKAILIDEFNFGSGGSITPIFATGAKSATNEYGTWTLSGSTCKEPWKVFDNVNTSETYFSGAPYDLYLDVPEGKSICPSLFETAFYGTTFRVTISGYNPETSSWEKFGTFGVAGVSTLAVNKETFYTRFKFTASITGGYNAIRLYEIRIRSGKIKTNG